MPLQFEPSEESIEVISRLLNATTPFFLNDDPLDTEPLDLTIRKHPHAGKDSHCTYSYRLGVKELQQ